MNATEILENVGDNLKKAKVSKNIFFKEIPSWTYKDGFVYEPASESGIRKLFVLQQGEKPIGLIGFGIKNQINKEIKINFIQGVSNINTLEKHPKVGKNC